MGARTFTSVLPRGLSRIGAATYIGVSVTLFDQLVADGRMHKPKRINSRKVWDRLQVDAYFDDLPEDEHETVLDPEEAYAQWKASTGLGANVVEQWGPKPYSPKSLAKLWGVSPQHVRDLIASGQLPHFKVGRLLRISFDAAEAFQTANRSNRNDRQEF